MGSRRLTDQGTDGTFGTTGTADLGQTRGPGTFDDVHRLP